MTEANWVLKEYRTVYYLYYFIPKIEQNYENTLSESNIIPKKDFNSIALYVLF